MELLTTASSYQKNDPTILRLPPMRRNADTSYSRMGSMNSRHLEGDRQRRRYGVGAHCDTRRAGVVDSGAGLPERQRDWSGRSGGATEDRSQQRISSHRQPPQENLRNVLQRHESILIGQVSGVKRNNTENDEGADKTNKRIRRTHLETWQRHNNIDSIHRDVWEGLPDSIKEEVRKLNTLSLGEITLDRIREFVAMLKEAGSYQRDKVQSLRERFRHDEQSLKEFKAKYNRQKQQVDARIKNGQLADSRKKEALELLEGEFGRINSREQWLGKQQDLLQQRETYLKRLEHYTSDQISQMEALK